MFKIELGNIKYGWVSINLYNDEQLLISMSGTGVYNPFYEIPELFKTIQNNKEYIWEVDQEGYDGQITFIPDGENIVIKTKELRDHINFPETINTFKKEDILTEINKTFTKWEKENNDEMYDIFYDFYFNIRELNSLYETGKYDGEVIERIVYTSKLEKIIEIRDTKEDSIKYKYVFNDVEKIFEDFFDSVKVSSVYKFLKKTISPEMDVNEQNIIKSEAIDILKESNFFSSSYDYLQYLLLN